jgi:hypothetical protein
MSLFVSVSAVLRPRLDDPDAVDELDRGAAQPGEPGHELRILRPRAGHRTLIGDQADHQREQTDQGHPPVDDSS